MRNSPVTAFAAALVSALAATRSDPCCMARNMYAGPAETGRQTMMVPQNGPRASAATEAETTIKAVISALAATGSHRVAVIVCDLPPAGTGIRAALRQDSLAGRGRCVCSHASPTRHDAGASAACQVCAGP